MSMPSPIRTTLPPIALAKAWMICVLWFGILHNNTAFAQHVLPPLYPVNVPNFTIPFDIEESAGNVREIELLVSKDRGKRWQSVDRMTVRPEGEGRNTVEPGNFSGKFSFRADSDGEYWFAFRRIPLAFTNTVQLRVLVDTQGKAESLGLLIQPSKSEPVQSGPILPPKPERFRPAPKNVEPEPVPEPQLEPLSEQKVDGRWQPAEEVVEASLTGRQPIAASVASTQSTTMAGDVGDADAVNTAIDCLPEEQVEEAVENPPIVSIGPRFPGFDMTQTSREDDLFRDLLNEMRPFLDVQPVVAGPMLPQAAQPLELTALRATSDMPGARSSDSATVDVAVGGITGIELKHPEAGPQIVVNWNAGQDRWRDAQIDVLRGSTKEGPWFPIARNVSNTGTYWWFLTPADAEPFHVMVRIRSLQGGIREDVTQDVITIPHVYFSP